MAGSTGMGGRAGPIRRRMTAWGIAGLLLLLPLVAMQVSDQVNWDVADFVLFGAMLATACGTLGVAARGGTDPFYRAAVAVAVVTAFVLVWMNLAVGLIGSEDNPANWLVGGVLGTGIVGCAIGRFRARAMSRALVATTAAQALVGAVAFVMGDPKTLLLTALFVVPWLLSAWLFSKAERKAIETGFSQDSSTQSRE
jgi:hypothetical protein